MADRIALNRFSLQLVDAENQLGRMVLYYFHPKKRRTMEAIRVAFFISKIFVDEKFIHLVFIQKKIPSRFSFWELDFFIEVLLGVNKSKKESLEAKLRLRVDSKLFSTKTSFSI